MSFPIAPERYFAAPTFPEYLKSVEKNRDLWHGLHERIALPGWAAEAVKSEGLSLPSPERYALVRRFYARDRGESILTELLAFLGADPLEAVAGAGGVTHRE